MEVSGQLHAQAALSPGKEIPVPPLHRRLGGLQILSRSGSEEINSRAGFV